MYADYNRIGIYLNRCSMHISKDIRVALGIFILHLAVPIMNNILEQACDEALPDIRAYKGNVAHIHIDWDVPFRDTTVFSMDFKNATKTYGSVWGFDNFKPYSCEIENMDCVVTNDTPTHTKSLDCKILRVDDRHVGTYFFYWVDSGDSVEKCLDLHIVHDNGIQIITDIEDDQGTMLDQHKNAYVRDEDVQYTKSLVVPTDKTRYVHLQMADSTMQVDLSCYEQYNNIKKGRKIKKKEIASSSVSFPVIYPPGATFDTFSIVCDIGGPGVTIEMAVVKEGTNPPISAAVDSTQMSKNSYETAMMVYGGIFTIITLVMATIFVYNQVVDRQWCQKNNQNAATQKFSTPKKNSNQTQGYHAVQGRDQSNDKSDVPCTEVFIEGEPSTSCQPKD